jgi:hypothetical protein
MRVTLTLRGIFSIFSGTVAWERATDALGQVVQYKGHTYSSFRVQISSKESGELYCSSSRPLLSPVQSTFIGTAARGVSFQEKLHQSVLRHCYVCRY